MLSSLSTFNQLCKSQGPPPAPPVLLQSNITFPSNISNAINSINYTYSSGSGSTAYLNGTYLTNCSSQEYFTNGGGCWVVFNSGGLAQTGYWGSRYGGGGYQGNSSTNTLTISAHPYPFSAYTYVNTGTYNTSTEGEWVSIQLPYFIRPTNFKVLGRNVQGGGGRLLPRTPNGYKFEASNNGSTWTTLYTQANPSVGTAGINCVTTPSSFNVSTSNSFRYFRFLVTSIVGSGVSGNPQGSAGLCYMSITGDSYSGAI
jgi:hypothetical protein